MDDAGLDTQVRNEIYRHWIDTGRPPVPAELADSLGADQAGVEEALRRLHDAHMIVLAPGTPYVWMANPFSAVPTPFRVQAQGREWYGNCIWDSLGVVAMLGGPGRVTTWCPDCRTELAVEVADGALTRAEGVVHFAVPAARWWDDIGFN